MGVSIRRVLRILLELPLAGVFPRVEDPWPESIGLGFPFATAGVGGVLVDLVLAEASDTRRDRGIRLGGLWGFRIGSLFYLASFVVQLASGR